MNERPIFFGPDNGLLGILTAPDAPQPGAPVVILLNAGLLHRVGPNRLHVELARRLSDRGFASLRFDMSGVGDSELREGGLLYIERSQQDVVEAMDALEGRVGDRFVLMGLCTGAFNAFRTALHDDRVVGAALLDGYAYPTTRSQIRHYRGRVLQLDRWTGWVKRRRLGKTQSATDPTPGDLVVFENEVVPRDRFGRELAGLVERGVELFLVYTRLGPLAFNYERQMHDAFPEIEFEPHLQVRYYPNADHTFTLPGNRIRVLSDIQEWMRQRFETAERTAS